MTDEEMPSVCSESCTELSETEQDAGLEEGSSCRMSTSTSEENLPSIANDRNLDGFIGSGFTLHPKLQQLRMTAFEQRDSDSASMLSDYSELSGPVGQIFRDSGLTIIGRADLEDGNTLPPQLPRVQLTPEADEEAIRVQRKANLLSLAAEFAEVKRMDSDALPFDLHKFDYSDNELGDTDSEDDRENLPQSLTSNDGEEKCFDNDNEEVWQLMPIIPDRDVSKAHAKAESLVNVSHIDKHVNFNTNEVETLRLAELKRKRLESQLHVSQEEEQERLVSYDLKVVQIYHLKFGTIPFTDKLMAVLYIAVEVFFRAS